LPRSWLIVPLLVLYLYGLGNVGFLGPDEPRYASIGREMARSHDFITPRLDGQPWFEKPPLLYWMIAAGRSMGLPDEWAARLPVTLLSVAFLIFFYLTLAREFSPRIALASSTILATSAGWLAFSFAAVTDLPMTATFGAAMLIAMFDTRSERGYVAGALLGLSVLAKGLVPLVLFLPLILIARGKRLTMLAGCVLVSAPWYLLCGLRNGWPSLQDLIWKHHFERFFSPSLQHVQPLWFYLPIVLAGLFPWTPLAGLLFRRKTYDDVRARFLAAWIIYSLLFFSISLNKLPGYILPLMPALAIVLALGLDKAGAAAKWWLMASALLLIAIPAIAGTLPAALLTGIRRAHWTLTPGLPFVIVPALVWWLAWRGRANAAILAAGIAVLAGVLYSKYVALPQLDQRVSVRAFWRAHETTVPAACLDGIRREWEYGLNYYAGSPLHSCTPGATPRIVEIDRRLALEPPR
jgi:4-amino-4-deoxy-L-arabinose transferase-like glycosyltransferase